MIQITESAKKHLVSIITSNEKKVKLGVKGGGCSGFTYDWQLIDEELNDKNNLFVDGMSLLYLAGLVIDYNTDLFGSSLKIENPNIKSACGCGESFNV